MDFYSNIYKISVDNYVLSLTFAIEMGGFIQDEFPMGDFTFILNFFTVIYTSKWLIEFFF